MKFLASDKRSKKPLNRDLMVFIIYIIINLVLCIEDSHCSILSANSTPGCTQNEGFLLLMQLLWKKKCKIFWQGASHNVNLVITKHTRTHFEHVMISGVVTENPNLFALVLRMQGKAKCASSGKMFVKKLCIRSTCIRFGNSRLKKRGNLPCVV